MGFSGFGDIFAKARAGYPRFSKRLAEAKAVARWEMAVGPIIAKHTQAVRVKNDILYVDVDHPVWRTELHYRKRQILEMLNQRQAQGEEPVPIKDIVFFSKAVR